MKNALIITALFLVGYAYWLNTSDSDGSASPCGDKSPDGSMPPMPVDDWSKGRIMAHPSVSAIADAAPINGPMPGDDAMLQTFDASPFSTTVKLFARVTPGAGMIEEVNTYKGDYILYN